MFTLYCLWEKIMCEHNHSHHHHHSSPVLRVSIAAVIFAASILLPFSDTLRLCFFAAAYLLAGGDVVYKAVSHIVKGKIFDENLLMTIATLGAFAIKEYPEAVMVMILYQIGEYFQHRAVEKSRHSISKLMDIRPDYANLEKDGKLFKVNPETVALGDIIVVKTGEKIPLDGTIIEGQAVLDTSALTGESLPRNVKTQDGVLNGCINTNGMIKIKVEKTFGESTVAKILELVEHAETKKSKTENFITRFARYYTPAVVLAAVLLSSLPPLILGSSFQLWFERALTFLVISCPCALVISVPLSFFAGIGGASRNGVLIKGGNSMETLSKVRVAVFDKTGTLTKGAFQVQKINPQKISSADELLETAALAESFSNHPIALSLKQAYGKEIKNINLTNIEEFAGKGVKVSLNDDEILVGSKRLLEQNNISVNAQPEAGTVVFVAKNKHYLGNIVISDEIKDDTPQTISQLNAMEIKTVMLTGDNSQSAQAIAKKIKIDNFYANLLPAQKVEKIEQLMLENTGKVLFVGDGINDAPVLMRADIGIAMGGLGSDAAIEAADVVIMDDKPSKIVTALKISGKTLAIVKQNIAFALGVKALFLSLGALGMMTMWGAVFADVGVSVLAVLNSLRALRIK